MAVGAIDDHLPDTDAYNLAAAAFDVAQARSPAITQVELGVDHAVVALPRQLLDSHGIGLTVNASR